MRELKRVLITVICVIIVILVLILAMAVSATSKNAETAFGGGPDGVDDRVPIDSEHSDSSGAAHGVGTALHRYALGLTDKNIVGIHDVSRPRYTGSLSRRDGRAESVGGKAKTGDHKDWREFETWESLMHDKDADTQYMKDRAKALNDLRFDWSHVLAAVQPHLDEDREYIGIIDTAHDGTLRVKSMEASPSKTGEDDNPNVFASVPSELVEKISAQPGLFIFHTHPADPRGSPLPSPADISTAITMAYSSIYAANIVISRYGVILYSLGWDAYRQIHGSKDPPLAMRNLRYDAAAFFSTMRSWAEWGLEDYRKAFEHYGLLFVVYPSAEFVAALHLLKFRSNILSPTDFELLDDLRRSIENKEKHSKGKRPQK